MLDLNGFKRVNDNFGHEAGDDLLKQFSAQLHSSSRASDTVGRWGGDQVMVIIDGNIHGPGAREAHAEMGLWPIRSSLGRGASGG